MKSKKRLFILLAVLGVSGTALYFSRRSEGDAPVVDRTLVHQVKHRDLMIEVIDTGKVQPKEKIEIKSKVAGQVTEVLVEEGDRVEKGQLLLRLDPTDYERDVARVEADLAQARNGLEYAKLNLERKEKALADRGVAQIEVDLAKNEWKSKTVAVKSAEVALASARDRLRYTQITAPIEGTVMEVGIKQGEVVTPGVQQTFEGRPLLTIGDLSTLLVRAELNQIDIARIKNGQRATLSFDALPGRQFEARVTKTAPASIKPKGKEVDVFPVEATLIDADATIKPGMTADVRFLIDVRPSVLTVPIEAVSKDAGKAQVTKLVVAENGRQKKEQVDVELGARNDREFEIASGLSEGDELLVNPPSSAANEVKL